MAMTFHVDIVSAEGSLHSGLAEMIFLPAEMGEIGVLPRHAPLLTKLRPGEVRVQVPGREERDHYYVSGGLVEIQPGTVTILADTAIRAHDLDEAAALEAKQRAEDALAGKLAVFEYAKAQAELASAIAQLRAIESLRRRRG
ncbi:MAG: F0F1 ATP synthase subunit epsilon [Pseudomonadota bacterium]